MRNNPFYLTSQIPDEYFCDREAETDRLVRYVVNGNNVVLISPRRMGKSGLIHHCFNQREIKADYKCLYLDILQSSSLKEFVFLLGKAVYDHIVPKTQKWISKFFQTLKSLNGKFSIDAATGMPGFNVLLGEINYPDLTLDEIFKFLQGYNMPCLIAIDEFQQITKYPEKNVEAILRSHIQRQNNCRFIFSGSERHLMEEMFHSYGRPFYQSACILNLGAIEKTKYVDFAVNLFKKYGRKFERESIERVYEIFSGYTFYMQKTLNEAFSLQKEVGSGDLSLIKRALKEILETNSYFYRNLLSNISERQKDLLYSIAIEGEAESITSSEFIKRYNLTSASSVQSATKQLLDKDLISKIDGKYFLTDKFFSLWISQTYGSKPLC